jgi:hypothetical protein
MDVGAVGRGRYSTFMNLELRMSTEYLSQKNRWQDSNCVLLFPEHESDKLQLADLPSFISCVAFVTQISGT